MDYIALCYDYDDVPIYFVFFFTSPAVPKIFWHPVEKMVTLLRGVRAGPPVCSRPAAPAPRARCTAARATSPRKPRATVKLNCQNTRELLARLRS